MVQEGGVTSGRLSRSWENGEGNLLHFGRFRAGKHRQGLAAQGIQGGQFGNGNLPRNSELFRVHSLNPLIPLLIFPRHEIFP